jgi:hypothetical protein
MKQLCTAKGATLVVLFIPFKSQVYWPLLERSFKQEEMIRAFQFYFRQQPTEFDLSDMARNRLAQNKLMRRFCE